MSEKKLKRARTAILVLLAAVIAVSFLLPEHFTGCLFVAVFYIFLLMALSFLYGNSKTYALIVPAVFLYAALFPALNLAFPLADGGLISIFLEIFFAFFMFCRVFFAPLGFLPETGLPWEADMLVVLAALFILMAASYLLGRKRFS